MARRHCSVGADGRERGRPAQLLTPLGLADLCRRRGDGGFSMIEILVSIGVFGVVLMFLSSMLAVGMKGVLRGKQRAAAVQDNADTLEIARSLSYDNLGLALNDPTIGEDPDIVMVGGVRQYLVDAQAGLYEPIVWSTGTHNHPFNPHVTTFDRGTTTLTRRVYVTGVDATGDGSIDYKRVTAVTSWDPRGTQGASNEVRTQTLVAEGGLVPPDAPGGAGIPPMTARTSASAGSVSLLASSGGLLGSNAIPLVVELPSTDGSTAMRGTQTIDCRAKAPSLQAGGLTLGGHSVTVSADDDPTTAVPTNPAPQSSSASVGLSGAIGSLLSESSVASQLHCEATTAHTDGLPYGEGSAHGPASMTVDLSSLSLLGLDINLVRVLRLQAPFTRQSIDHWSQASRGITSTASAGLADLRIGEVPVLIPNGLVRVSNLDFEVEASAATGAVPAPAVTSPAPAVIDVFDPANQIPSGVCTSRSGSYCRVNLNPAVLAGGVTLTVGGQVSTGLLNRTRIGFETTVSLLPPALDDAAGVQGSGGETRWDASYTAVSISSKLQVSLTLLGITTTHVDTAVDVVLGQASASACRGVTCR